MKYLVILVILTGCKTSGPRQDIIMPSAYQFCIEYPDHEECQ